MLARTAPILLALLPALGWGATSVPHVLTELRKLTPLQQISLLKQVSQTDAAGRALAAVIIEPHLIDTRRADVERLIGADRLPAVAALAAHLQVEARANAQVLAALTSSPDEDAPAALDARFDGVSPKTEPAAPAVDVSMLTPVQAWPTSGLPRSVHAITAQGERFLINGKEAKPLRERRIEGSLVTHTLAHPDDPDVLVRVYHSPNSLEAYERKADKIEFLEPASSAGAAPLLLEHGEASVRGVGRVYFYAQRLLRGKTLAERAAEPGMNVLVEAMLDRLTKAGLALHVSDTAQNVLLSKIMFGRGADGKEQAFFVGAKAVAASPAAVAAVNAMIRALLPSDLGRGVVAEVEVEPVAPRRSHVAKLAEDVDLSDNEILVTPDSGYKIEDVAERHGLQRLLPAKNGRLVFPSVEAAGKALPGLLADPQVAQARVGRRHVLDARRHGAAPLLPLLKQMQAGDERDALLKRLPGSTYALTESADVAALLELPAPHGQVHVLYNDLPVEAWRKLRWDDLERLARRWHSRGAPWYAFSAVDNWLKAHPDEIGAEPTLSELADVLKPVPPHAQRDDLVARLPQSVYARARSSDVAALLRLGQVGDGSFVTRLTDHAWKALSFEDAESLIKDWGVMRNQEAAVEALRRWLEAHPEAAARPDRVISWLSPSKVRDQLIIDLRAAAWNSMSGEEAAAALALVQRDDAASAPYGLVSPAAWARLGLADIKTLARHFASANFNNSASSAIQKWLTTRAAEIGGEDLPLDQVIELLSLLPSGPPRDEALFKIPASAYEAATAETAGMIAGLVHRPEPQPGVSLARLPTGLWKRLGPAELQRLVRLLQSGGQPLSGPWAAARWLNVAEEKTRDGTPLAAFMSGFSQDQRDWFLQNLSALAFDASDGADVAAVLQLVHPTDATSMAVFEKIARAAWLKLGFAHVESLTRALFSRNSWQTAALAAQLWAKANETALADPKVFHSLRMLLATMHEHATRDAAITAVPASAYTKAASADVAAVIGLLSKNTLNDNVAKIPEQAWTRLSADDMRSLMAAWLGANLQHPAGTALAAWVRATKASWDDFAHLRQPLNAATQQVALAAAWRQLSVDAAPGDIVERLSGMAEGAPRDQVLLELTEDFWKKAEPAVAARLLSLASAQAEAHGPFYAKLPESAWTRLGPIELDDLVSKRLAAQNWPAALAMIKLWTAARIEELGGEDLAWQDLRRAVAKLPDHAQRDDFLMSLPGYVLQRAIKASKMTGTDFLSFLELVGQRAQLDATYDRISAHAWQLITRDEAQTYTNKLQAANLTAAASSFASRWLKQRITLGEATIGDAYESLRVLSEGVERDKAILSLPPAAYEKADSRDIGALLKLASSYAEQNNQSTYARVPPSAWRRLKLRELVRLTSAYGGNMAHIAMRINTLWLEAHGAVKNGPTYRGAELLSSMISLAESPSRDKMILELPPLIYFYLTGTEAAQLVTLLSQSGAEKSYADLPEDAWVRMTKADLDIILQKLAPFAETPQGKSLAELALKRWLDAHN